MEEYTFEAILLLAILANYHKSDAAKLNPYLKRIKDCEDAEFMRKLCWASNFALSSSVKYAVIFPWGESVLLMRYLQGIPGHDG